MPAARRSLRLRIEAMRAGACDYLTKPFKSQAIQAALARALERAGMAPAGSGEAVTVTAQAANFDPNALGELAALTGNPVPGLARELARRVPQTAVSAVHRGATSQDIIDITGSARDAAELGAASWGGFAGGLLPRAARRG